MDFFGIGPMEILLILLIALIIFGPGKLPEIGRTIGRATRTLKKATFDLTTQVTKELEGKESGGASSQNPGSSTQPPKSTEPRSQGKTSA